MNTCVSHIARWQAYLSGFVESPFPSPEASEDEDDDSNSNNDDDDEDEDASSPNDDEKTTRFTYPLSFVTKRGSSFGYESSHVHKGIISIGDFC